MKLVFFFLTRKEASSARRLIIDQVTVTSHRKQDSFPTCFKSKKCILMNWSHFQLTFMLLFYSNSDKCISLQWCGILVTSHTSCFGRGHWQHSSQRLLSFCLASAMGCICKHGLSSPILVQEIPCWGEKACPEVPALGPAERDISLFWQIWLHLFPGFCFVFSVRFTIILCF